MTLIRVQAIGSGTQSDPVRADMPTFSLVGYDPVTHLATIDVPDEDLPDNLPRPGQPSRPNTAYGPVLITLPQGSAAPWTSKLRQRYPVKGPDWNPPQVQ